MNLVYYRTLSLEFRRLSSNMLMADADSAFVQLKRFKNYIDSTQEIRDIIQERISGVEFDFKECFLIEGSGWNQIVPPVDEACHLKAQYDYMTYLCSQDRDIRGVARGFIPKSGSWNDIVRDFLNSAFKPLVDYIIDSLAKKIMLLEGDKVGSIIQNINNNYGNVNAAGRDVNFTGNIRNSDINEIKVLIEKLITTIHSTSELTDEEKENLVDDMETINEQIDSKIPKKPRLRKAFENIKNFVLCASKGAATTTTLITDLEKLVDKLGEIIGKIS